MKLEAILETALYAEDLDQAERFYTEVLGLEVFSRRKGRHVFFRLRQQMLLIFNPHATRQVADDGDAIDIPTHGALGPGHVAFAVTADELSAWRLRLTEHQVAIEVAIRRPSGAESIYFRDPAGNSLELATPSLWFDAVRLMSPQE